MADVIPVVFCFDSRIVLGSSVAIKSLLDCAKESTVYDIRVFHSDLSLENQKNISAIAAGSRHQIAFHYIDPAIFAGAPHNNKSWTELVYYRLLIPEIMPEYDKVIYSDVDVLFKGDLSEVYKLDLTGYEMAAVPVEINNQETMICHKYFPENSNDKIYISSFLVMNSALMRSEGTVSKFMSTIRTIGKRLKMFDLDTMNIACDRFLDLPFHYGTFQSVMYNDDITRAEEYAFLKGVFSDAELLDAKANTIMIHYAGRMGKPWRMKNPYPDYQAYMDALPKGLKKYTLRDLRKKLFNKR